MHELQAAIQIIEMVRKEMDRRKFTEIGRIGVRIGALSGFNPDALVFSFDAAAAETPLSNTRLDIEYVPIKADCRDCHKNFELDELIVTCPSCGSSNLNFSDSDNLEVSYIE